MTRSAQMLPNRLPYGDLYIYYLEGSVPPQAFFDDRAFLGNWEEEGDSFLFFGAPRLDQVRRLVQQQPRLVLVDHFHMTYEQWQGGLPVPFGIGRLKVLPPWHADAGENLPGSILLDPGVVFGTGTHSTTHDCLRALQMAFDRHPVHRAVDLGTGTGLLALAAIRLGAAQCVAVDLNRLAARTALRNVHYNDMARKILVIQGDAKNFIDLPCELMVSNIHYDIMRHLLAAPGFRHKKQFILSGLLRSQALEIKRQLTTGTAKILQQWTQEGIWYTFYGENT